MQKHTVFHFDIFFLDIFFVKTSMFNVLQHAKKVNGQIKPAAGTILSLFVPDEKGYGDKQKGYGDNCPRTIPLKETLINTELFVAMHVHLCHSGLRPQIPITFWSFLRVTTVPLGH